MPNVYEDARCFGYFGFGGGYEIGKLKLNPNQAARHREDGALYCNTECPLKQECWTAHRERVRALREALEDFDRRVAESDERRRELLERADRLLKQLRAG